MNTRNKILQVNEKQTIFCYETKKKIMFLSKLPDNFQSLTLAFSNQIIFIIIIQINTYIIITNLVLYNINSLGFVP